MAPVLHLLSPPSWDYPTLNPGLTQGSVFKTGGVQPLAMELFECLLIQSYCKEEEEEDGTQAALPKTFILRF